MSINQYPNIVFVGSGAIATALGNILAADEDYQVVLLSIEQDVIESVNEEHVNKKYFPIFKLSPLLRATDDKTVLLKAKIIFLAIPSVTIVDYLRENQHLINPKAILVNLAKGFGSERDIIPDCLGPFLKNTLATLKGPSFAREILYRQPTAFTLASKDEGIYEVFTELFENTTIYLDYSNDVVGVEYASILKNIYAIVIGIVDAQFDSPNLRSLVLTRAINEMRSLISRFGGREETMFNYCGFGDFTLTALNDLSRNRTLGLLIGKGFFTSNISDRVVLEGRIAVNVLCDQLSGQEGACVQFPLMTELHKVFNQEYDINNFVSRILRIM
ncbi:MAG: 2-dehydropantoate 2-reductase N-terminal domain-containing protein [Bacteroidales bacterium]|nr:2-dehydropantoate 2-reductase N-terminal domain-containing protein [Bacteroidales bacterium]